MDIQINRPEDWAGVTFEADEIVVEVAAASVLLGRNDRSIPLAF